MNFFTPELDLHNEPEQLERQNNLSNVKMSEINKYNTTLYECDCSDFKERRLPCKHIYKLAKEQGLFKIVPRKRSDILLADFSKGYADGWKFIVRPCNYLALDILMTPRTVKKKTVEFYTQGDSYQMMEGSMFYDTNIAYEKKWIEALKDIKYVIQVIRSTSNEVRNKVILEDNILVRREFLKYGIVKFSIAVPNEDHTGLKEFGNYNCTQDKFVNMLRTGILENTDGKVLDLFEKYRIKTPIINKSYQVIGSSGNVYTVSFSNVTGELKAHCTCTAGEFNTVCKHIFQVMEENSEVAEVFRTSELKGIYDEYNKKIKEHEQMIQSMQKEEKDLKRKFSRLLLGNYRDR